MEKLVHFIRLPFYYNGQARKVLDAVLSRARQDFSKCRYPLTDAMARWSSLSLSCDADGMATIGSPANMTSAFVIKRGVESLSSSIEGWLTTLYRTHNMPGLDYDTKVACNNYFEATIYDVAMLKLLLAGSARLGVFDTVFDFKPSETAVARYKGEPFNPLVLATLNVMYNNVDDEMRTYLATEGEEDRRHHAEILRIRREHASKRESLLKEIDYLLEHNKLPMKAEA